MEHSKFEKKFEEFILLNSKNKNLRILKRFNIQDIEKFEKKHKISLPLKFRTFITKYGRGIINKKSHKTIFKIELKNYNTNGNKLNPSLEFDYDCRVYFGSQDSENTISEEVKTIYKTSSEYRPAKQINGIILLEKDDNPFFIVVNGKEFGNIWCDNYDGGSQIMPYNVNGENRMDFYDFINFMIDINKCWL